MTLLCFICKFIWTLMVILCLWIIQQLPFETIGYIDFRLNDRKYYWNNLVPYN